MTSGRLVLLLLAGTLAAGELGDEAALRKRGVRALRDVLRHVDSSDPDRAVRARRVAKLIALDYYRAATPPGMRLVAGRLVVTPTGIRSVGGFYMGVREVTAAEFREFARKTKRRDGPWARGEPNHPVVLVTLDEARAYARWRGLRLPTRRELEHAATAGGRLRYPWGDRFDPRRVNSKKGGSGGLEPVGSRPAGRSVDGIDDLLGGAAEWSDTSNGEQGERQRFLVVGGSFRDRVKAARFVTEKRRAGERRDDVGFRLARSLPALKP